MKFDVESILSRAKTSLRSKSEWKDILLFGTNERILRVFSEALAEVARYDEYLTRETKWTTARNTSSLLKAAAILNYRAHRNIGARGVVQLSVDENFASAPTNTVDIPKFTVFSDGGDIKITSLNNQSIVANLDNYIEVDVVQGEPKTFETNAIGSLGEIINVPNSKIENSVYELYVNGVLWTETTDLRLHGSDETVYKVENALDFQSVDLRFGDNLNGRKLNAGDSVRFQYVETLGAAGNISKQGKINTVESTVMDDTMAPITVFVTNIEAISGGKDTEEKEDIRTNAPSAFQTGGVAVTKEDFRYLLESNSNILKASVWGAYDINQDAGTPGAYLNDSENFINVAAISTSETNLTPAVQETVRSFINEYKSPTDVMRFETVEFVKLKFYTNVFVRDRSQLLSSVKSAVLVTLQQQYSLDNVDFEQNLYESDYMALIDGIDGVDYHDTSIALVSFSSFNTSSFEADIPLFLPPVKPQSVKVYVKHNSEDDSQYRLMATDDGAGNFTMEAGFARDPLTSSIDYSTGSANITISSGLPLAEFDGSTFSDYDIRVENQVVASNFVLQKRQQIFQYYSAEISTQYL